MRQDGLQVRVAALTKLTTAVLSNVVDSSLANFGPKAVGTGANQERWFVRKASLLANSTVSPHTGATAVLIALRSDIHGSLECLFSLRWSCKGILSNIRSE
jgi:hypothetical protein